MDVDRLLLHDALHPDDSIQIENETYAWDNAIDGPFVIDSLTVEGVGTLDIPFKQETISSIIRDRINIEETSSCEVPAKKLYIPFLDHMERTIRLSVNKKLSEKFAVENLNANIYVYLKSLVICQTTEVHTEALAPNTPGILGVYLLRLPFELNTLADIKIKTHVWGKTNVHNYQDRFFFTFLAGKKSQIFETKVTVESLGKSPVAFLAFSLVWEESHKLLRVVETLSFPTYLKKIKQAKEAIVGWKKLRPVENGDSRNSEEITKSLDAIQPKTRLLCIPARHDYCSFEFRMDNLKRNDVFLTNVLKMNRIIDVNLVVLKIYHPAKPINVSTTKAMFVNTTAALADTSFSDGQAQNSHVVAKNVEEYQDHAIMDSNGILDETSPTPVSRQHAFEYTALRGSFFEGNRNTTSKSRIIIDWENEAASESKGHASVHRWVQGSWTYPNIHQKFSNLCIGKQLVGNVACFLEDESLSELSQPTTYHPAFIIRPRKEAIIDCWNYSPARVLQCLTQRLDAELDRVDRGEDYERYSLLHDVNFILDLVVQDVGELDNCHRTAILHQLLFICTQLDAVDEGLKIVELIPQRQCRCRRGHMIGFEGIYDKNYPSLLEDVVAELVSLAGWERCSNLVCAMYARHETQDHIPLFDLSYSLANRGHIHGAVIFAKCSLQIVAECENWDPAEFQESYEVRHYIGLAFSAASQNSQEIYSLLEKVAKKNIFVLFLMIHDYFQRLSYNEEKLDCLKSSIERIVQGINFQDFIPDMEMVSIICFLHQNQSTAQCDIVWNEIIDSSESRDSVFLDVFETILANEGHWNYLFYCAILYKAIASTPIAKERFYKFIENKKANPLLQYDWLNCCFHVTMADIEPCLADEGRLMQSFCSVFKEMSIDVLTMCAEGILHYNQTIKRVQLISPTICSALLDCLPINDLNNIVSQENAHFCNIMYCYDKLGSDETKLALIKILRSTFLEDAIDDSVGASIGSTETTRLLMETLLVCLKAKLYNEDSNKPVIAYQVLIFFKFYLETNRINPSEASAGDFAGVSHLLTLEFLEKTLIALYERENERAPTCLKDEPWQWNISQALADLMAIHPEMKKEFLKFEPVRITNVMRSFFWLGSKVSNEQLAQLMCSAVLSSPKDRSSLFLLLNDELQNLAICSPFAFAALKQVVRHCVRLMFNDAEFAGSWSRSKSLIHGPPEVVKFYSDSCKRAEIFGPFSTMCEGRAFGEFSINHLPWADYVVNKCESSYYCLITKLYPADLKPDLAHTITVACQILRLSYDAILCLKSYIKDMSNYHKCVTCIVPFFKKFRTN